MLYRRDAATCRPAFTLVELLVSLALTLFIMVIVSQAFLSAMETFRQLKAIGDLNARLRLAAGALRSDLQAAGLDIGGVHKGLADVTPPLPGGDAGAGGGAGYFRIWQDAPTASATIAAPITPAAGTPTLASFQVPTGAISSTGNAAVVFDCIDTSGTIDTTGLPVVNQESVYITQVTVGTPMDTAQGYFTRSHYDTTGTIPVVLAEGSDPDNIPSIRTTKHNLAFTVNLGLLGQRREDYFSGAVDANPAAPTMPLDSVGAPAYRDTANSVYNGQWAEVAYFLAPTDTTGAGTHSTPNGLPLFNLYRRIQVVVDPSDPIPTPWSTSPNPSGINDATATGEGPRIAASRKFTVPGYFDISCRSDPQSQPGPPGPYLFFNSSRELTIPERRYGTNQAAGTAGYKLVGPPIDATQPTSTPTYPYLTYQGEPAWLGGADLLLTDVVSFEVQVFPKPTAGFSATAADFINIPPNGHVPANTNAAYPTGVRVFDTWSMELPALSGAYQNPYDYQNSDTTTGAAKTVPWRGNILALQITIRIWDFKSQKTRQITIWQSRLGGTS